MYQEATRQPYSFWFIYDKANMFYKRWEERFVVDGDAEPAEPAEPVNGRLPLGGGQQAAGGRAHHRERVQHAAAASRPTSTTRAWPRCRPPGVSGACPISPRLVESPEHKPRMSTTSTPGAISGSDSNFTFELPETLHMQSSAKMAVYKVRIADAFLSTDGAGTSAELTRP